MKTVPIPRVDPNQRVGSGRSVPIWPPQEKRTTKRQKMLLESAGAQGVRLEADPFNICILNYTMTCPLACDYCCYSCGPRRTETMNLDFALSVVGQAVALGVFTEFGFTGGEALIYFDDILILTEIMRKAGIPFSMISSCDWASERVTAEAKLGPLLDNGMSVFTISHDPSHERWVPREHVLLAGSIVPEAGCRLAICGSFYDSKHNLREMFPEFAENPSVSFVTRVVLPTPGRASHRRIMPSFYPEADLSGPCTCYKRVYHDITVFWDGEVYPCCSVYNRDTPELSFGNLYETPLSTIWDAIEASHFLHRIKWAGFDHLEKELVSWRPELAAHLPTPGTMIGPCDRCHQFFRNQILRDAVIEWSTEREIDSVRHILRKVAASQPNRLEDLAEALGIIHAT